MKKYLGYIVTLCVSLYMSLAFADPSSTVNLHVKISNQVSDQSFILKKTTSNASAKQYEGRAIINKAAPFEFLVPFQVGKHNLVMNVDLPEDAGRQCSVDVWYYGGESEYNVVVTNYSNQYRCATELDGDKLSVVIQDGAVEQVLVPFKIKNNTHEAKLAVDILELAGISLSINYNNRTIPAGLEGVYQARYQDGVDVIFHHNQKNERMNLGYYAKLSLNIMKPDGFTTYRMTTPDFILFNNTLIPQSNVIANPQYKVEWLTGDDGVMTLSICDTVDTQGTHDKMDISN